ncbi:MAG: hypothetical protein V3V84_08830 [Candidatus Bathyarchaeia archaeon]
MIEITGLTPNEILIYLFGFNFIVAFIWLCVYPIISWKKEEIESEIFFAMWIYPALKIAVFGWFVLGIVILSLPITLPIYTVIKLRGKRQS